MKIIFPTNDIEHSYRLNGSPVVDTGKYKSFYDLPRMNYRNADLLEIAWGDKWNTGTLTISMFIDWLAYK